MFQFLFIGLFVAGAIYVVFFLIFSTVKAEKNFSMDVYRYLSRRYSNTVIVDYGGLSTDPIIHSHNAGPFKLIEVKVISEKETTRTDQDLILRGEVDLDKFQKGSNRPSLTLSPQLRWEQYPHDIVVGIPKLDDRFIISSNDTIFPRYILAQTDLGNLIQKSFDLEEYFIRWVNDNPIVQVRMETMSSNSFIQAFNILLGTIGALSEKGYLTRSIVKKVPVHEERKPLDFTFERHEKPVQYIQKVETKLEDTVDVQEDISKPEVPKTSWKPPPAVSEEYNTSYKKQSLKSPYKSLFTSIQYQTKSIEYKSDRVIILTYSRTTPEIVVTFPEENHALFTTIIDGLSSGDFELQIVYQGQPRQIDWSDAWKDIEIQSPPKIIEKLRVRTGIAHRITTTGETMIIVKDHPGKGIECNIKVPKTIRGINSGYSLLKDITWFIEMIFM
ncbi:MAG: hypothetical protein ACFFC6_04700 [Promethearchaeota archaeon]